MKEYEAHRKGEDALKKCINSIYKEEDTELAVRGVYTSLLKFYGAQRVYLFELEEESKLFHCTYELRAPEADLNEDAVMTLTSSDIDFWIREYGQDGEIWIDTKDTTHHDDTLLTILSHYKVNTCLVIPIREGKHIIGFMGIDDASKSWDDSFLLRSVTIILYSEIQRRRKVLIQQHEAEKQKQQLELDKSIIEVLANDYSSAFLVNLETDSINAIRMDHVLEARFGDLLRSNIGYSPLSRIYINAVIHEDDREEMYIAASAEFLRESLKQNATGSRRYRCLVNGHEEIFEAKYAKVGRLNDSPKLVVVGLANREAETREELDREIELKEANRKAEEASRAKSTFLFNMSHDIRTPMNAILGYTEMALAAGNDIEKSSECMEKVKIASKQLLSLVNDVLDMARIENGRITIEETPNNIVISTNNIFQLFKQSGDGNNLSMVSEYRSIEHNRVFCDEQRLNRIFTNIISNSVKYTRPGGEIHFIIEELPSTRKGYARYRFTVTDTGIGMSEDFLSHIFDSFTRERSSTVSGIEGAGLGMAITKELVGLMGGTIDVQSELGVGTVVSVRIDFRIAENVSIEKEDELTLSEEGLEFKRVLLVEDNEMNREIARNLLESRGLIVEEATDGSIAVEKVLEKEPDYYDYVLMDIQMPYMDGYKATQTIRGFAEEKYSKLPIIAMTANAFEEDKERALKAGMDAHLAKPINVKELFRILQKYA